MTYIVGMSPLARNASGWKVSTGFAGPNPCFVTADASSIWVGSRGSGDESRRVRAFDLATGQPGRQVELEAPLEGNEIVDGTLIAQPRSRGSVSVFDLASGKHTFTAKVDAQLAGASRARILLTRADRDPPELVIVDSKTGTTLHSVKLGLGLTLERNGFFVAGSCALVVAKNAFVGVNLETGRSTFKTRVTGYARVEGPFEGQVFLADDVSLTCVDVAVGKVRWTTPLDASVLGESLGAVRIGKNQAHLVAWVERRDGRSCLITQFDRLTGQKGETVERTEIRGLSYQAMASPPRSPRAVLNDRHVELYLDDERAVRLPLPEGRFKSAFYAGGRFFALGNELVGIDLATITGTGNIALTLTPVASSSGADSPAEVTFAGTSSVIMVRHPLYGDTRVIRTATSPNVKAGDRLILEGVSTQLGGVVKVESWRLAEPGSRQETPAPTVLGIETLPTQPLVASVSDEALLFGPAEPKIPPRQLPPLTPLVKRIEKIFGRDSVPLLHRLVDACDESPATRERWERAGATFDLEPYEPVVEVPGFNELEFTAFAAEEGHLVVYGVVRSGTESGVAALYVEGDHDFEWFANGFDDWFARILSNSTRPAQVRFLLEDLKLPATTLEIVRAKTPAWFSAKT